jgi:hypothetical protein
MQNDFHPRVAGLPTLIGNTPLLAIEFLFAGKQRFIYARAENLNMTGSIKDRMAFHICFIIREANFIGWMQESLKSQGRINNNKIIERKNQIEKTYSYRFCAADGDVKW